MAKVDYIKVTTLNVDVIRRVEDARYKSGYREHKTVARSYVVVGDNMGSNVALRTAIKEGNSVKEINYMGVVQMSNEHLDIRNY